MSKEGNGSSNDQTLVLMSRIHAILKCSYERIRFQNKQKFEVDNFDFVSPAYYLGYVS